MTTSVSDARSNPNDQIAHAARVIGRSNSRRLVFDGVSSGKRAIKTVEDLASATGLTRKQVLVAAKHLVSNHIVSQTKKDGDTAYEKDAFYSINKRKILTLAGNPKKLDQFPTKTNPRATTGTISLRVSRPSIQPRLITIDDIDSFSKVSRVADAPPALARISEKRFKDGFQKIIGEVGQFLDWGGERSDLFSTRLRFGGRRIPAAIAFKGPGMSGKLTPGKMGRNGDQIQRLFESEADVFLVQYWDQIAESVLQQMRTFAVVKALATGRSIFFGTIDGTDSARIMAAYPAAFLDRRQRDRKRNA